MSPADPARTPVTCVVTDDHELMLSTTTTVLEGAGYAVVGAAATGEEALRTIASTRPVVAVVDFELPDMTGVELAARLREVALETRLVLHSARIAPSTVDAALAAGIRGVVVKGSAERLLSAVAEVREGAIYLDPSVAYTRRDATGAESEGPSVSPAGSPC